MKRKEITAPAGAGLILTDVREILRVLRPVWFILRRLDQGNRPRERGAAAFYRRIIQIIKTGEAAL